MDKNALTIDGMPNFNNPQVLAAYLDLLGMNLTMTLHTMYAKKEAVEKVLSPEEISSFLQIHTILCGMRNAVGIGEDWHGENMNDLTLQIADEIAAHRAATRGDFDANLDRIRAIAKEFGVSAEVEKMISEYRNEQPASVAAESILADLYNDSTLNREIR